MKRDPRAKIPGGFLKNGIPFLEKVIGPSREAKDSYLPRSVHAREFTVNAIALLLSGTGYQGPPQTSREEANFAKG